MELEWEPVMLHVVTPAELKRIRNERLRSMNVESAV